jgi:thioredoxin 1
MNEIILTDATFDETIKEGVVLVDFWAPWCGPCRIVGPIVEEIATEYAGRAKVGKMNVDENNIVAQRFGIMSIPTLILFKDGIEVEKIIGAQPKEAITAKIDQHL